MIDVIMLVYTAGVIVVYGIEIYKSQHLDELIIFDSIAVSLMWPVIYFGKFVMYLSKKYLNAINYVCGK